MSEFGLKYAYRPYRCLFCGLEKEIGTNHTDICYDHCQGCSWRGGMRENGQVYHPGQRPFQYTGPDAEDELDLNVLEAADRLLPAPKKRPRLPRPKRAELQVSWT